MSKYKYILDKSSKKFHCPKCGKRRFVRFIHFESGEYLDAQYGRCDREAKCSYFNSPNGGYKLHVNNVNRRTNVSFVPVEVLEGTLNGYHKNIFIQNLLNNIDYPFALADIEKVISLYYLGTITDGYRCGAITFPFIDVSNKIRAIQVKNFDENNNTIATDFLHSMINKQYQRDRKKPPKWLNSYYNNEVKVSCLFGAHLLEKYPKNPIGLVEAPKTAVYSTLYFGFPKKDENILWLAVYNLSSLNVERCKVLEGRKVFLFPDLSKDSAAYESWSLKSKLIEKKLHNVSFKISTLLECNAKQEDRDKGKDLADYLITKDWRLFR